MNQVPLIPKEFEHTQNEKNERNEKRRRKKKQSPVLELPEQANNKLLMHSCCAPCVAGIMKKLQSQGIEQLVLFYNPNILPREEYEIRKNENKRYADKLKIEFIDLDYDSDNWFKRVKGMEHEPERGIRCSICFDMRFERTALFAHENSYKIFATSLGISRWKDLDQVNASGFKAANRYKDVSYLDWNWRKSGGSDIMIKLSKEENFYQQEYCGCVYSLRDANLHRIQKGKSKIIRNVKFYSKN